MEGVNKRFEEVEKLFNGRESVKEEECQSFSLQIVSSLTDILKNSPKNDDHNNTDRVCEFIDKISEKEEYIWDLSGFENDDEILISFLKEQEDKGYISQIDKI